MITVSDAIISLEPNAGFTMVDENIETLVWTKDDATQPSNEDILAEQTRLQAEYDNNQYQRDRAVAYASIQDQLDMQYWDSINGTTKWKDHIAAVKAKYPKPS